MALPAGIGKVIKDGEQVTVKVYLYDAVGSVYGTIYRHNGITPVPNAEVHIFNASGDLAFAMTDDSGQYLQGFIPLGSFSVEVFEAATVRRGANSGRIDLAGQEVPVNIVESAIGQVKGNLFAGGDLSPLKGWEVSLSQPLAWGSVTLSGTTGIDGGFSFPGVSIGTFSLNVYAKEGLGSAHADGRLTREGEDRKSTRLNSSH